MTRSLLFYIVVAVFAAVLGTEEGYLPWNTIASDSLRRSKRSFENEIIISTSQKKMFWANGTECCSKDRRSNHENELKKKELEEQELRYKKESDAFNSPLERYFRGKIDDTSTDFQTIDHINKQIEPLLSELLGTNYFRYYKVDLFKACPFWKEQFYCVLEDCAVETLENEEELPEEWRAKALSAVDFQMNSLGSLPKTRKTCFVGEKDFCQSENENSPEGKYVNLLKNPERFTGYGGESAAKIWSSIYKENCFDFLGQEIKKGFLIKDFPNEICTEKRVFYKIISGLHASISTHICQLNLNRTTGEWYSDLDCYLKKVGFHPERVGNLYFLYSVVLQAIRKASDYLAAYKLCDLEDDEANRQHVQGVFNSVVSQAQNASPVFIEDYLFLSDTSSLKMEFKNKFRNISRIMDCVGCEKCRLWGKVQISGLGTALKILFSYDAETKDYKLTRSELISLFNSFGRLSQSVLARKEFGKMWLSAQKLKPNPGSSYEFSSESSYEFSSESSYESSSESTYKSSSEMSSSEKLETLVAEPVFDAKAFNDKIDAAEITLETIFSPSMATQIRDLLYTASHFYHVSIWTAVVVIIGTVLLLKLIFIHRHQ